MAAARVLTRHRRGTATTRNARAGAITPRTIHQSSLMHLPRSARNDHDLVSVLVDDQARIRGLQPAPRHGVATSYEDWAGNPKQVPESTVEAVLAAIENEGMIQMSRLERGLARPGERLVVTAGIPFDMPGTTNLLKIEAV